MKRKWKYIIVVLILAIVLDVVVSMIMYSKYTTEREKIVEGVEEPKNLVPTDLTEDNNAYNLVLKVNGTIEKTVDYAEEDEKFPEGIFFYYRNEEILHGENAALHIGFIDSLEVVVGDIRQISKRKYCVENPPTSEEGNSRYTVFRKIDSIAQFLSARAIVAAHRGDIEKMVESLVLTSSFKHFAFSPPHVLLEDESVRRWNWYHLSALASCFRLLGERFPVQEVRKNLVTFEPNPERIAELKWEAYRLLSIDLFNHPYPRTQLEPSLCKSILFHLVPALTYYKRYVACVEENKYWEYRQKEFVELEKLNDAAKSGTCPAGINSDAVCSVHYWTQFTFMMKSLEQGDRILLAVSEYYKEHKSFPESIDQIADSLIPEDLINKRTGEKIRFVVEEGRLIVWGVSLVHHRERSENTHYTEEEEERMEKLALKSPVYGKCYMAIYKPFEGFQAPSNVQE